MVTMDFHSQLRHEGDRLIHLGIMQNRSLFHSRDFPRSPMRMWSRIHAIFSFLILALSVSICG